MHIETFINIILHHPPPKVGITFIMVLSYPTISIVMQARQSSHKGIQSSRKKRIHAFLGIQQCPAYFTLDDDSAITKVAIFRGVGVVWSIRLSQWMSSNNSQHIPREATATIYSSRLMECPNCSCLMQLGVQIEIQNSSSGVAVDLRIKRLDIVRIPTSNRLFRHDCCSCEIKNYYITVKVHFGDNVNRQTFWKFTVQDLNTQHYHNNIDGTVLTLHLMQSQVFTIIFLFCGI